jgi:hypothetical protein
MNSLEAQDFIGGFDLDPVMSLSLSLSSVDMALPFFFKGLC